MTARRRPLRRDNLDVEGQPMTSPTEHTPTRYTPGILALLLARGCPEHALDAAIRSLAGQILPPTVTEMLRQADEAIVAAMQHAAENHT